MTETPNMIAPNIEVNLRGIPKELQDYPQWCLWKYLTNDKGEIKKTMLSANPYAPRMARTNMPDTWVDFRTAAAEYEEKRFTPQAYAGLTFVLTKDDPFVCVDLDNLKERPQAQAMLTHITSFTKTFIERSPSGSGVHVWGTGAQDIITEGVGAASKGFEVYKQNHFMNMTGSPIPHGDLPLTDIGSEIEKRLKFWLNSGFIPQKHLVQTTSGGLEVDFSAASAADFSFTPRLNPVPYATNSVIFSDEDVLKKLRSAANAPKFIALWGGDSTTYHGGDESRAEEGIATMIAFYTKDPAQIERIIFESAWGTRTKWATREDYRASTIAYGIAHAATYNPSPRWGTTGDGTIEYRSVNEETGEVIDFITHPMSDIGNARRLAGAYGDLIRWDSVRKLWFTWNEQYWEEASEGRVMAYAFSLPAIIATEALATPDQNAQDKKFREKLMKWSELSGNLARAKNALEAMRSLPYIEAKPEEFDALPHLLNCLNGTVDLRTGVLYSHRRQDLISKITKGTYNPGAQGPVWADFLSTIFDGDTELIDYVQRCAGYSATGSVAERVFFLLHGDGRNGKSTLTEIMKYVLGDYAMTATSSVVTTRRDGEQDVEASYMVGSRLVTAAETGEMSRIDEAHIKKITGGEVISARKLFVGYFQYQPAFKIWLSTNHLPQVRGTDEAIWDRIIAIPFAVRIPDQDVDYDLKEKLQAEASAILSWMVVGAVAWYEGRLGASPRVVKAHQETYQKGMDLLGTFIEQECVVEPGAAVTVGDLYTSYSSWTKDGNEFLMTKRAFAAKMRLIGFETERRGNRRVHTFVGICRSFDPEIIRWNSGVGRISPVA